MPTRGTRQLLTAFVRDFLRGHRKIACEAIRFSSAGKNEWIDVEINDAGGLTVRASSSIVVRPAADNTINIFYTRKNGDY